MNAMEGCCGGMAGMILIGLLAVTVLILLMVWLVKRIKK